MALDPDGRVLERIEGYAARILERREDNPTAEELADPAGRDADRLRRELVARAAALGLDAPEVALAYLPGMHELDARERRRRELAGLRGGRHEARGPRKGGVVATQSVEIEWLESGKPVVKGDESADVSLSHDDRAVLATAGDGPQGCDLAQVTHRPREQWVALLGSSREQLLDRLLPIAGGPDLLERAGTRDMGRARGGAQGRRRGRPRARAQRVDGDSVVFRGGAAGAEPVRVLTFPVLLTRRPERVVAVVVRPSEQVGVEPAADELERKYDYDSRRRPAAHHRRRAAARRDGCRQLALPRHLPRDGELTRTLYFSHLVIWMGKLQGARLPSRSTRTWRGSSRPAAGGWSRTRASSGSFEAVEAEDVIEGRFYLGPYQGPFGATQELCSWRRILPGGGHERVAWSKMKVTWVEISGHGIVEPQAFPDYYQTAMNRVAPPDTPEVRERLVQHPSPDVDLGALVHQVPPGAGQPGAPRRARLRDRARGVEPHQQRVSGNYYLFQGRTRDHFFQELAPELYRGTGKRWRVAMPVLPRRPSAGGDAIRADRGADALESLHEHGASLRFDFFSVGEGGGRRKLATGRHVMGWFLPGEAGDWRLGPVPEVYRGALLAAAGAGP